MAATDVGLDHSHAVGGQGAGLVGADRRRVAHRLTGIQVPDEVIVSHHFLKEEITCESETLQEDDILVHTLTE